MLHVQSSKVGKKLQICKICVYLSISQTMVNEFCLELMYPMKGFKLFLTLRKYQK